MPGGRLSGAWWRKSYAGRPKGPDSRAELSLSVVECHLGWLNRAIWPGSWVDPEFTRDIMDLIAGSPYAT